MSESNWQLATLGGGCFWCLEAVFEQVDGVDSVVSGYCGGHGKRPDYAAVCAGNTGHAEVVRIRFDADEISYQELLEIFFVIHDPTTLNRQGNDIGTQYRSAIFYHSAAQKEAAESLIARLQQEEVWSTPPVTEVRPVAPFFAAEEYHQHYFGRNPGQAYCQLVVAPKLANFRQRFAARIRKSE